MNRTHVTALLVAILALAVGATACREDSSSIAENELHEAFVTKWTEDGYAPDGVDVDCAAEGFLAGIGGVDGAAQYEVTAENLDEKWPVRTLLTEEHAQAAAKGIIACDDFSKHWFAQFREEHGVVLDPCFADAVADHIEMFVAWTLMDEAASTIEDFPPDLVAAIEACSPDQFPPAD